MNDDDNDVIMHSCQGLQSQNTYENCTTTSSCLQMSGWTADYLATYTWTRWCNSTVLNT